MLASVDSVGLASEVTETSEVTSSVTVSCSWVVSDGSELTLLDSGSSGSTEDASGATLLV